jgi:hypothetical protein
MVASLHAFAMDFYSASEDIETEACILESRDTGEDPSLNTRPVEDLPEEISPP